MALSETPAAEALAYELNDRFGFPLSLAYRAADLMMQGVPFAEAWTQAKNADNYRLTELMAQSTERSQLAEQELMERVYRANPGYEPAASMDMREGSVLINSLLSKAA